MEDKINMSSEIFFDLLELTKEESASDLHAEFRYNKAQVAEQEAIQMAYDKINADLSSVALSAHLSDDAEIRTETRRDEVKVDLYLDLFFKEKAR